MRHKPREQPTEYVDIEGNPVTYRRPWREPPLFDAHMIELAVCAFIIVLVLAGCFR